MKIRFTTGEVVSTGPQYLLAADAAAQGDRELPTFCHPRRVTSQHVLDELQYASDLFQRAQRAIDAERIALEAAGIFLDRRHTIASMYLALMAAECQLIAIERRAA